MTTHCLPFITCPISQSDLHDLFYALAVKLPFDMRLWVNCNHFLYNISRESKSCFRLFPDIEPNRAIDLDDLKALLQHEHIIGIFVRFASFSQGVKIIYRNDFVPKETNVKIYKETETGKIRVNQTGNELTDSFLEYLSIQSTMSQNASVILSKEYTYLREEYSTTNILLSRVTLCGYQRNGLEEKFFFDVFGDQSESSPEVKDQKEVPALLARYWDKNLMLSRETYQNLLLKEISLTTRLILDLVKVTSSFLVV